MKVVFSYDCEGNWGCLDWPEPYLEPDKEALLENAYRKIVELHKKYNIVATAGFVGLYILPLEDRLEAINKCYPKLFIDKYPNMLKTGGCWEGYRNFNIINDEPDLFEIASHGFAHVPFDQLDESEIERELSFSKKILGNKSVGDVNSFIFPRNMISHTRMVSKYFDVYRNTPSIDNFTRVRNIIRAVSGFQLTNEKEINDFIFWKSGVRKNFSDKGWRKLWRARVEKADNELVIHAWSHPHNFITDPSLFKRLEWLLSTINANKDNVKCLKMQDLK